MKRNRQDLEKSATLRAWTRDLKTFAELGYIATGLEGAVHLAVMARAHRLRSMT
jgi:hypothetical protein